MYQDFYQDLNQDIQEILPFPLLSVGKKQQDLQAGMKGVQVQVWFAGP